MGVGIKGSWALGGECRGRRLGFGDGCAERGGRGTCGGLQVMPCSLRLASDSSSVWRTTVPEAAVKLRIALRFTHQCCHRLRALCLLCLLRRSPSKAAKVMTKTAARRDAAKRDDDDEEVMGQMLIAVASSWGSSLWLMRSDTRCLVHVCMCAMVPNLPVPWSSSGASGAEQECFA